MTCHNCGAALPPEARFCKACGADQHAAPVEGAPPERPRPRWLLPVAVVAVAVLVALVVRPWNTDDGEPALTSLVGASRVVLRSGPTAEPERVWSIDAEDEGGAVAIGRDHFFVSGGSDDEPAVVARSLSDGDEAWAEPVPGVGDLIARDDDLIVAVADDEDDGTDELRSYDQGSGDVNWSTPVDEEIHQLWDHDDLVISMTGPELMAHRAADGEEVWSVPTDRFSQYTIAVTEDAVFVASGEKIRALSLDDGEQRWSVKVDEPVFVLAVSGDRVVVPDEDDVVALDAGNGEERWRVDPDVDGPPLVVAVDDSTLVVSTPDGAVALDSADGEERDDFDADEEVWRGYGQRLPNGDILMQSAVELTSQVVDRSTGEILWSEENGVRAVSGSMLFVTDDSELSAYDLAGERKWTIDLGGGGFPVVGDGCLLIRSEDGYQLWR